jgi:hypothetical protein
MLGWLAKGSPCLCQVLLIPWLGHFMWPFAVAGLGLRYLRISFLDRFGQPFRKPVRTAFNYVKKFGLHNDWCANLNPFARIFKECVKLAGVIPGWIAGCIVCGAQSSPGADCGRAVHVVLVPLIGRVHRSVDSSL